MGVPSAGRAPRETTSCCRACDSRGGDVLLTMPQRWTLAESSNRRDSLSFCLSGTCAIFVRHAGARWVASPVVVILARDAASRLSRCRASRIRPINRLGRSRRRSHRDDICSLPTLGESACSSGPCAPACRRRFVLATRTMKEGTSSSRKSGNSSSRICEPRAARACICLPCGTSRRFTGSVGSTSRSTTVTVR